MYGIPFIDYFHKSCAKFDMQMYFYRDKGFYITIWSVSDNLKMMFTDIESQNQWKILKMVCGQRWWYILYFFWKECYFGEKIV